ncbi:hypothetical protein CPAR01_03976 [Colletotrichum paranaense]|uniref:Uncharacterized protein n=1 Tax=Colletotrichum paranaense TaxID=1914294 RepID=A0ABQ9SV02_9PEZI|nr:uncharacterized protein CPAR01_03976 [Colletotrichum paranaense]KAK1543343.1 hypothetical protein CPAR01_03976 [Colletotrichum paranaense]
MKQRCLATIPNGNDAESPRLSGQGRNTAHFHSSNQKNGVLGEEADQLHRPRQTCEVEKPQKDHRRMGALSSGPFHLPRNARPGPALSESSCLIIAALNILDVERLVTSLRHPILKALCLAPEAQDIVVSKRLTNAMNIKDAIQSEALGQRLDVAALCPLGSESWSKRLMQFDKISIDKVEIQTTLFCR